MIKKLLFTVAMNFFCVPTIGEVTAPGWLAGSSDGAAAAAAAAGAAGAAAGAGAGADTTWVVTVSPRRLTRTLSVSSSPYSRLTDSSVRSFSFSSSAKALMKATSDSYVLFDIRFLDQKR